MFIPESFDAATVAYILASMPADQLEKAEQAGLFDLIKSRRPRSDLHPERVIVHGKTRDYLATRQKSNKTDGGFSQYRQKGTRKSKGKQRPKNSSKSVSTSKKKRSQRRRDKAEELKRQVMSLASMLGGADEYHNLVSGKRKRYEHGPGEEAELHNAKGTIRDDLQARRKWSAKRIPYRETIGDRSKACNRYRAGNDDYRRNCVNCVLAYEARSRMIAVRAGKRLSKGDKHYVGPDHCFLGNPEMLQMDTSSPIELRRNVEEWMTDWGNGARAFIMVGFGKDPKGPAHVFVAEQASGRTRYVEPQNPSLSIDPVCMQRYYNNARFALLMRVDNLEFSDYAKYRLEHEDGRSIE